jgi:uncharacterized membrane protein
MSRKSRRNRTHDSRPAIAGGAAPISTPVTAPKPMRVDLVDAARGIAITMMIAYHFCFDLTYYQWADWPMLDDPRWIAWRSAIVTCFLLLVGISLALRDARERGRGESRWFARAFVLRWVQIVAAASFVTAGSSLLFPQTFIYFGVLHFVAVALWICRRAPRRPWLAIVAGVIALAAGMTLAYPAFNPRYLDWIGFASEKPLTEDYVPLFPWLGVVLIGCGLGGFWTGRAAQSSSRADRIWQALPTQSKDILALMGRWSLTIYLVHQPLLLGAMGAIRQLF